MTIVNYKIPNFWACPRLVKNAETRSGYPRYTIAATIPHAVIANKVKQLTKTTPTKCHPKHLRLRGESKAFGNIEGTLIKNQQKKQT